MSSENLKHKVIIRTSVGSKRPLNPQHQHVGNFSSAFKKILTNIEIIELKEPYQIFKSYKKSIRKKRWKTYFTERIW